MKILIAVDGSVYTHRMLTFLADHGDWFGTSREITVLHCVIAVPPHAASAVGAEATATYYRQEAEQVLGPIRTFLAEHRIDARIVHVHGHPAEQIARIADAENFDLIIMGSAGKGELRNLVLGSVPTQVMARCKKPVLLVR